MRALRLGVWAPCVAVAVVCWWDVGLLEVCGRSCSLLRRYLVPLEVMTTYDRGLTLDSTVAGIDQVFILSLHINTLSPMAISGSDLARLLCWALPASSNSSLALAAVP